MLMRYGMEFYHCICYGKIVKDHLSPSAMNRGYLTNFLMGIPVK